MIQVKTMRDAPTRERFVKLRAEDWSYERNRGEVRSFSCTGRQRKETIAFQGGQK
jgi:hypothetical protein